MITKPDFESADVLTAGHGSARGCNDCALPSDDNSESTSRVSEDGGRIVAAMKITTRENEALQSMLLSTFNWHCGTRSLSPKRPLLRLPVDE